MAQVDLPVALQAQAQDEKRNPDDTSMFEE